VYFIGENFKEVMLPTACCQDLNGSLSPCAVALWPIENKSEAHTHTQFHAKKRNRESLT